MKQKNNRIFLPLALAMMALSSCSSPTRVDPIPEAEASSREQTVARTNQASYFTEVSFDKGSSHLEGADQDALKDLVKKSMADGIVDQIKVLTWADEEYPSTHEQKLSSSQRYLADARNQKIKNYLKKNYPSLDISVYNMASRPNEFQKLFKTADARTKQSFENAGLSMNDADMNPPAKASKAVVLSILKK